MNYIKTVVNKLVKQYATSDPYELASNLKIKVIIDKMPLSIRGFYSNVMSMGFIYLNCELHEIDRKIVCAHELGHAMLHPCANSLFLSRNTFVLPSKLELQADIFAANLLVSDNVLNEYSDETVTLDALSAELNLPIWLLELKYNSTKTI
ncbi:MAG: ImmA/IrrE family metallo-endopeptidase [Oscillospiraceae bacterium]